MTPSSAAQTKDRKNQSPAARLQIALPDRAGIDRHRHREREAQYHENGHGEPRYPCIGPITQRPFTLQYQPTRAEQGVTKYQAQAGEDRERVHPAERSARVLPVDHWNSPHHRTDGGALHEGDHDGTPEEARVPQREQALAASAKLKRDTPKNQTEEQQQHRNVERAEKHRVDHRERGKQACADDHQPCLVAVPERRDGIEHVLAMLLGLGGTEQDSDAEIEPVQ